MIRHLPFFVVAAEEENFQRASQRLNIAQSALSRRIRDLEYELGNVPLFERMSRGVRLTPSGRILLEEARDILERVEDARKRAISIMNGHEGVLNIGFSIGALRPKFMDDILAAIRENFPKVSLNTFVFSVTDLQKKLRERELDAAIYTTDDPGDEFKSLVIGEEEFLLAMPDDHRLASVDEVTFPDLAGEDLIWYAKMLSPATTEAPRKTFEGHGKVPRIVMESPSPETTLQLVGARLGIGIVPPMSPSLIPSNVVMRPIAGLALSRQFHLVWLRGNHSFTLGKIIAAVTEKMSIKAETQDKKQQTAS